MMYEQCAGLLLQASHDTSFSAPSSPAGQFPLTPEQIRIRKERQAMIKKEIGTIVTLYNEVDQEFIYGNGAYKRIELKTFYEKYTAFIDGCKQDAQWFYPLDLDIKEIIHDVLEAHPTRRNIGVYKIVGEMPKVELDENGEEQLDHIFNVSEAKKYIVRAVQDYIDSNYVDVYRKCYPQLPKDSKKVFRVSCCGSQFHEKCLIACQMYKVSSCPHAQCQTAENGTHYSKSWDSAFYEQTLQANSLSRDEIARSTCMLCEDSLQSAMPASTSLPTLRKRGIENNHSSKKQRK